MALREVLRRGAMGSGSRRACIVGARRSPHWSVAIVGSGPAALYVADTLLKKDAHVHVSIFERLPVPYGLVRYGVAPDHQDVKKLTERFAYFANEPRVTFFGNVEIGGGGGGGGGGGDGDGGDATGEASRGRALSRKLLSHCERCVALAAAGRTDEALYLARSVARTCTHSTRGACLVVETLAGAGKLWEAQQV